MGYQKKYSGGGGRLKALCKVRAARRRFFLLGVPALDQMSKKCGVCLGQTWNFLIGRLPKMVLLRVYTLDRG